MKKFLAFLLSATLLFCAVPFSLTAAAEEGTLINPFPEFKDNLKRSFTMDDGYLGIPVDVYVYERGRTEDNAFILYVINHLGERIGTDSDTDIINDFLDEGYVVGVVDYRNNYLAEMPYIDSSIQSVRLILANKLADMHVDINMRTYVLPAGYRIVRNIEYFSILDSAAVGTKDFILSMWNNTYFEHFYNGKIPGGWFKADSVDQLIGPDGNHFDYKQYLDIIYPANPKEAVPLMARSSSAEFRNDNDTTVDRPFKISIVMSGYACACYDHEYVPMSRDDVGYSYMYNGGDNGYDWVTFTIAPYNAVKVQTAAIRCLRYYAEDYGYDVNRIGVYGMSKSCECGLLGNVDPEKIPERSILDPALYPEVDPSDPYATYGEQPFLTYRDGTPIPSNAQFCFFGMGDAMTYRNNFLLEGHGPELICCGKDAYGSWSHWPSTLSRMDSFGVETVEMSMPDLGHEFPHGADPVYKYDRYDGAIKVMDYYLAGAPVELLFTTPTNNSQYDGEGEIMLQFSGKVNEDQVKKNVKLVCVATGEEITGTWKSMYGGTRWTFSPDKQPNDNYYDIIVSKSLKGSNGKEIKNADSVRFVCAGQGLVIAAADTYIDDGETVHGAETAVVCGVGKDAYFTFDNDILKAAESGVLKFTNSTDTMGTVKVYGYKGVIDEETMKTEPNAATDYLGEVSVNGAETFEINVGEYVTASKSEQLTFILKLVDIGGTDGLSENYDDMPNLDNYLKTVTGAITSVSDTYSFSGGYNFHHVELSDRDAYDKGGQSLKAVHGAAGKTQRFKLTNTFGKKALTMDDVGKQYIISFDFMKSMEDGDTLYFQYGMMGIDNYWDTFLGKYYGVDLDAFDKWQHFSFPVTITEEMIKSDAYLLSFVVNGNFYIDNIAVKAANGPINIYSKEASVPQSKQPQFLLDYKLNEELDPVAVLDTAEAAKVAVMTFNNRFLAQSNGGVATFELYSEKETDATVYAYTGTITDGNLPRDAAYLGTLHVDAGYKTYEYDVSDYIKANESATVSLCIKTQSVGLERNFNDGKELVRQSGAYVDPVSDTYDFTGGYDFSEALVSNEVYYGEEGCSLYVHGSSARVKTAVSRFRMFNTFGYIPSEADLGKTYHVTCFVRKNSETSSGGNISVGLMSIGTWPDGTDPRPSNAASAFADDNKKTVNVGLDQWTKVETDLVINQPVLDRRAFWLCFEAAGAFYLDDISVVCTSDSPIILTKEASEGHPAPKLTLFDCLKLDDSDISLKTTEIAAQDDGTFTLNLTAPDRYMSSVENIEVLASGKNIHVKSVRYDENYGLTFDGIEPGEHEITVRTTYYDGSTAEIAAGSVTVEKDILFGDVNGDGKIDNSDLIRLKKYLAGQSVEINSAAADVTGDGKVDNSDLIRLKKYLAGQSVELGK